MSLEVTDNNPAMVPPSTFLKNQLLNLKVYFVAVANFINNFLKTSIEKTTDINLFNNVLGYFSTEIFVNTDSTSTDTSSLSCKCGIEDSMLAIFFVSLIEYSFFT